MVAPGYGVKSQDWSYLTAKKAIYVQSGVITDPSAIDDAFIIDTTVDSSGNKNVRARQQTLVIFVIPKAGATLTIENAKLHLWINAEWDDQPDRDDESSSSLGTSERVGSIGDIAAKDRWALIEVAQHDTAVGTTDTAVCYSFPWLPAGRYKAALAAGLTGEAIIAEQHTE